MGYLYQPKLKSGGTGRIYWCKYYVNGRAIRESTKCAKEKDARDFLKRREGAVANGAPIAPRVDGIRYEELAEDLRRYYATTGKRDKAEAETRPAHLDRFFTHVRVVGITPTLVARYVEERQRPRLGPKETTIRAHRTAPSTANWGCSRGCCASATSTARSCACP